MVILRPMFFCHAVSGIDHDGFVVAEINAAVLPVIGGDDNQVVVVGDAGQR